MKKIYQLLLQNPFKYGMLALLILLGIGTLCEQWAKNNQDIRTYQNELQTAVSNTETEVLDLFNNGGFVLNAIQNTMSADTLQKYEQRPYTLLIFDEKDSLVFWTNNKAYPYKNDIGATDTIQNLTYRLQNSTYLFLKAPYRPVINGKSFRYTMIGLLPIYEQYSIQNDYLQDIFSLMPASFTRYVRPSEQANQFFIQNQRGEKLLYLQANPDSVDYFWAYLAMFFYFAFGGILSLCLYAYAVQVGRTQTIFWGILTLMIGIVAIRIGAFWFEFPAIAKHFGLFSQPFTSLPHWWSNSLGEFLLEVAVVGLLGVFIHKELRLAHFRNWTDAQRRLAGVALYGQIFWEILTLQGLLQNIIYDSYISFQFNNLSKISVDSFLALFGVLGCFLIILLVNYQLLSLLKQLGFGLRRRLPLFFIGFATQAGAVYFSGLAGSFDTINAVIFSAIFSLILSVFINVKRVNLAWSSLWLIFFAIFLTAVFRVNSSKKILGEQLQFAETTTLERDQWLETQFLNVETKILGDDFFKSYFNSAFISRKQVVERLLFRYLDDAFFGRYKYSIATYSDLGEPHRGELREYSEFIGLINKSQKTRSQNLYFYSDSESKYTYIARLPIETNGLLQGIFVIEFSPLENTRRGNIFWELLQMSRSRKEIASLDYKYALYKKEQRIQTSSPEMFPIVLAQEIPIPKSGEHLYTKIEDEHFLVYKSPNSNICLLRIDPQEFTGYFTIFAYIFCTGVVWLIAFASIGSLVYKFLNIRVIDWNFDQTLRERIQRGILLVSLCSFVAIGLVTILYFRSEYTSYHKTNLANRVRTTYQLAAFQVQMTSDGAQYLPNVHKLAKISQLDVNMYNLNGELISSSTEDIFERRLLSREMNPTAMLKLQNAQNEQFINTERISNFSFLSAYVLLRDYSGSPIAYLNLPYDSENSNTERAREVAQFLGALLNVYVVFLILAGAAAMLLAGSITRPLAVIADKLRQVTLNKKNEALEWTTQDEIGELVKRYNQMIQDLEANKQALERTQRESAWRDMAKQVAHEIKNPLTPMKLNIQFLQKLFSIDPEKARKKMDTVIQSLIEQIDNLAHIASEFSNFAKMPTAQNEHFDMFQLLQSVVNLFLETETDSTDREPLDLILLPFSETCSVFLDKNQWMRVLNNLIKNAMQAVPEDRKGKVQVSLETDRIYKKARLSIQDNGCGISEEQQKKIFVPYFTSKTSGSGIGLAMCKNIVEAANGHIWFETQLDEGTTFFVEFPLEEINQ